MNDEERIKEEIQQSKRKLNDENKAKLNELELFKKVNYQILNGWTDLVYELGKNIEEVCKLASCEFPQIEHIKSKYASLRFDYYFTTPVPEIVEKLIDSLIYEAENKSERICEYCGADGSIDVKEDNSLILKNCDKCSNLTSDEELAQALLKSKRNQDNWYSDELLELVARIQEHAKNKVISKVEYIGMLDGVIRTANLIKEKMLEDKELVIFNPKDFTVNCFYKQPNADKPSVKTISNVIRKYLGTMNKQDIHTLCKKFGKDRVLKELNDEYKELFEIGFFDFKGMKIPLTGNYEEYELFKELLEIIKKHQIEEIVQKDEIIKKLKELKSFYLHKGVEIIGIYDEKEYKKVTIFYKLCLEIMEKSKADKSIWLVSHLEEILNEIKTHFEIKVDFELEKNLNANGKVIFI